MEGGNTEGKELKEGVEGRKKEGRVEGRKEGREGGMKKRRKEGRKEGRREGRKEGRKTGGKERGMYACHCVCYCETKHATVGLLGLLSHRVLFLCLPRLISPDRPSVCRPDGLPSFLFIFPFGFSLLFISSLFILP